MSDSVTPWIVACQAPLSVGFSRQEYRSGKTFPSPGALEGLGKTEKKSPGSGVLSMSTDVKLGSEQIFTPESKVAPRKAQPQPQSRCCVFPGIYGGHTLGFPRAKWSRSPASPLLGYEIFAYRDFPGGSVVKTPHFQCRGCRFNPWSQHQDSTHFMAQSSPTPKKIFFN